VPGGLSLVLKSACQAILDFFLPAFCLFCQSPLPPSSPSLACSQCLDGIDLIPQPLCSCCGAPFRGAVGPEHLCQDCLTKPPPFSRARAVAFYDGVVLEAIHRLKYQRRPMYAKFLGQLLASSSAAALVNAADLLIPVPLHPRRLRWRGFNQALLLAQTFPHAAIARDILVRRRPTLPQIKLSPEQRQTNVKDAFTVPDPALVKEKAIVLLDDVYTTGATVKECARVLRRAGAATVEVVTVARVGYA
jgi:ComF family protein